MEVLRRGKFVRNSAARCRERSARQRWKNHPTFWPGVGAVQSAVGQQVLTAFSVLFVTVLAGSIHEKPVYRAKALIEIDREMPASPIRKSYFNWMKFPTPIWKRSTKFWPAMI